MFPVGLYPGLAHRQHPFREVTHALSDQDDRRLETLFMSGFSGICKQCELEPMAHVKAVLHSQTLKDVFPASGAQADPE